MLDRRERNHIDETQNVLSCEDVKVVIVPYSYTKGGGSV